MTRSERSSRPPIGWNFFFYFPSKFGINSPVNTIDWINIHRIKGLTNCKHREWKIFDSIFRTKNISKKKKKGRKISILLFVTSPILVYRHVDMSLVRTFTVKLNNRGTFPRDRKQRRQMNPRGSRPPSPPTLLHLRCFSNPR